MLNRLISNIVLGFFAVVLIVVYGMAKQAPTYQDMNSKQLQSAKIMTAELDGTQTDVQVAGDLSGFSKVVLPNGKEVSVRIANTVEERDLGLSNTEPLKSNEGMLFVFETEGNYGIWMKEMKYNLDIVWLDANGTVVKVVEDAKAPKTGTSTEELTVYKNSTPASFVLELPAGSATSDGVMVGTKLIIS